MGLDFDRIKHKVEHGTGHQWTSYSDLFLVLSVTFLLLYTIANLRGGAAAVVAQEQLRVASTRMAELEKQMKAYEVMKDDYLEKGASKDEVEMYKELENQLTLLEDEAKSEYQDAAKRAREAKVKFNGLNRYQALVKNIVNANLVSSAKSKRQLAMLDDRDVKIEDREETIEDLDQESKQKDQVIEQNENKIAAINKDLDRKRKALKNLKNVSAKERRAAEESMRKAQQEADGKIAALEQENAEKLEAERKQHAAKFGKLKSESTAKISELEQETKEAGQRISKMESDLANKSLQAERLMAAMQKEKAAYENQLASAKAKHAEAVAAEKAKLEGQIRAAQMTAAEKAAAEKAMRERLATAEAEMNAKLSGLSGDLEGAKRKLASAERVYGDSINALQKSNQTLQRDLNASVTKLNAQRRLAQQIKANLRAAGVDAAVDPKTGDVTISFGDEYFDTGSATLKPGMKEIVKRTMPIYAKSLFENAEIARKLESVEIVGFASPTFQGRVVDPQSLATTDRAAVNYNMDLSYRRARSIFDHVTDQRKMTFERQRDLLPLIKVSGRSYLAAERGPAATGQDNLKKHQIVVIRFTLRE
ncbi:MAG: hypothetical protein IPJ84_03355 [Bdellovibrionales bacterium]|jgi:outer membrane protein OmpA-like peptidoglycan-associated protein|nr:hypothetical protein [Bdellovibrionales bacterium]